MLLKVSYFNPKSWWSSRSVSQLGDQLLNRMPQNMKHMRFITLTIDPNQFVDENNCVDGKAAYHAAKHRLRRFFADLSRELNQPNLKWMWKLELHETGLVHYHLLIDYRQKIDFKLLQKLWPLGFVWVAYIKHNSAAKYVAKYVSKSAAKSADALAQLPDWVLDYPKRIRVYQSYNGFLSPRDCPKKTDTEEKLPEPPKPQPTLRQKLVKWDRTVVIFHPMRGFSKKVLAFSAQLCISVMQRHQSLSQTEAYASLLFENKIQPWCALINEDYANEYFSQN